jgi:hypothetical protein
MEGIFFLRTSTLHDFFLNTYKIQHHSCGICMTEICCQFFRIRGCVPLFHYSETTFMFAFTGSVSRRWTSSLTSGSFRLTHPTPSETTFTYVILKPSPNSNLSSEAEDLEAWCHISLECLALFCSTFSAQASRITTSFGLFTSTHFLSSMTISRRITSTLDHCLP